MAQLRPDRRPVAITPTSSELGTASQFSCGSVFGNATAGELGKASYFRPGAPQHHGLTSADRGGNRATLEKGPEDRENSRFAPFGDPRGGAEPVSAASEASLSDAPAFPWRLLRRAWSSCLGDRAPFLPALLRVQQLDGTPLPLPNKATAPEVSIGR
jgi:hypothetical protein